MAKLQTIESDDQQAPPLVGTDVIPPPGWAAGQPRDANPRWRPAPEPASGALVQDPDFEFPTIAGPLAFRLFHNSNAGASDSPFGFARRASWPLHLSYDGT